MVEADDGPRDHVARDDDDEDEQVLEHVSVAQQDSLCLARLKLSQYPAPQIDNSVPGRLKFSKIQYRFVKVYTE